MRRALERASALALRPLAPAGVRVSVRGVQWKADDWENYEFDEQSRDAPKPPAPATPAPWKPEKPKPKSGARGATAPGIAPKLEKTGPAAGNANTVPEVTEADRDKLSSQSHLARMMTDGASFV